MPGMRFAAVAAAVFVCFVLGAFLATRVARSDVPDRFRVSLFILYCLGISAVVGFTRRPMFPFHHWPLLAGVLPDTVYFSGLIAVDSVGAEQEIDFRAWEPMNAADVAAWAHSPRGFFALDSAAQVRAARYLIRHVEVSRQQARAGQAIGTNGRLLGPLAAPTFVLFRPVWTDAVSVPAAPIVGLRWIVDAWRPLGPGRTNNFLTRARVHEVLVP